GEFSHLRVKLETGRTHQIRVHMAHIGHPLVGDSIYGGKPKLKGLDHAIADALRAFPRQALHAAQLGLIHPQTGAREQWRAPMPDDMAQLLTILAEGAAKDDWP